MPVPSAAPNSALAFTRVHAAEFCVPDGYEVLPSAPPSEVLRFKSQAGASIVGCKFMQKWEKHGWCLGKILSQNADASMPKVNGKRVNFICEYDGESGTAEQAFSVDEYSDDLSAAAPSWALLSPTVASCVHERMPSPEVDATTGSQSTNPVPPTSPLEPQAFIRELLLWMDNCGGTNKNQYVAGSFAALLALGLLDVLVMCFMLAYHGKFGPDVLAQKAAGSYNSGDTFNEAMLINHFTKYSKAQVYDGSMLRTWKEGSSRLFHAIDHITSYREFMFIADDGEVNLGCAVDPGEEYRCLLIRCVIILHCAVLSFHFVALLFYHVSNYVVLSSYCTVASFRRAALSPHCDASLH